MWISKPEATYTFRAWCFPIWYFKYRYMFTSGPSIPYNSFFMLFIHSGFLLCFFCFHAPKTIFVPFASGYSFVLYRFICRIFFRYFGRSFLLLFLDHVLVSFESQFFLPISFDLCLPVVSFVCCCFFIGFSFRFILGTFPSLVLLLLLAVSLFVL